MLTATCTMIASICGMVVAVPPAGLIIEPFAPASAGYVRTYVAGAIKPLEVAQNSTNVAVERLIKVQLEGYLDAAKKDPGAQTSPIVREKIQELQSQIDDTNARINAATHSQH